MIYLMRLLKLPKVLNKYQLLLWILPEELLLMLHYAISKNILKSKYTADCACHFY